MKKVNEAGKQRREPPPLALQPRLDRRGGITQGDTPLFPPAGTFKAIGGQAAVARIVDGLYDRIEADTRLRPVFNRDLVKEREKVTRFFAAWFGGSPAYFDMAWSSGLAGRHEGISISRGMASRWVGHFLHAFSAVVEEPSLVVTIKPIISHLAMALVNRADEPLPGERLRGSTYNVDPQFLRHIQRDDAAGIATLAVTQPYIVARHGPRGLLSAALRGKTQAVAELLRQGVDVNVATMLSGAEAATHGLPMLHLTPLCGALAKHRDPVVALLVAHGAYYDIFSAACVGDLEAVRQLLAMAPELAEACDPASDVAQVTPLLHAVYAGQFEVARLLLQRGAHVGRNSGRLVRAAANNGHAELTNLLLDHGADPTTIAPGTWVLYPAIAATLLAGGADVNHMPGAWIGLCCTGNSGHKENLALARALLRYGADTAAFYKGQTALHCAAKAGFVNVVAALIEHGGDVNARNARGQTPLDAVEAAGKSINKEPVRRLLIAQGARRSKPQ